MLPVGKGQAEAWQGELSWVNTIAGGPAPAPGVTEAVVPSPLLSPGLLVTELEEETCCPPQGEGVPPAPSTLQLLHPHLTAVPVPISAAAQCQGSSATLGVPSLHGPPRSCPGAVPMC